MSPIHRIVEGWSSPMRAVADRTGPGGTYEAVPNADLGIHTYLWNYTLERWEV